MMSLRTCDSSYLSLANQRYKSSLTVIFIFSCVYIQ